MKRIMIALFTTVLLASCSSDDDNANAQDAIVGSWTLIEANSQFPIDLNNDGTADPNFMIEVPCFKGSISFTDTARFSRTFSMIQIEEINGVPTFTCDGNEVLTGTYEIVGSQIKLTIDGPEPTIASYAYVLEGDILKFTMPFGDFGNIEMVTKRD